VRRVLPLREHDVDQDEIRRDRGLGRPRAGPPRHRLLGRLTPLIRNAVLHINNEQPLLADLYSLPAAADVTLLCTNLRDKNGKRPVFADDSASVFVFPMIHMRFIEIAPGSIEATDDERPRLTAGAPPLPGEPEEDLEIDEDFLRRVRDA
jgi:hypothetical protein